MSSSVGDSERLRYDLPPSGPVGPPRMGNMSGGSQDMNAMIELLPYIYPAATIKSLHSSCGYLVALCALSDIFNQVSNIISAFFVFSPTHLINIRICVPLMTISAIGLIFGYGLILSIATDRLVAIALPINYRALHNSTVYILGQQIIPLLFTCCLVAMTYNKLSAESPNSQAMCQLMNFFVGSTRITWGSSGSIIGIITLLVYLTCWIVVWLRKAIIDDSSRKSLVSLTIIAVVFCCGWFGALITIPLTGILGVNGMETRFLIESNADVLLQIACSLNYFIYFRFSSIYRGNFQRQLNILTRRKQRNGRASTVTTM